MTKAQADISDARQVSDPAALWLCQLPGMTPALLYHLLATGDATTVMQQSSGALRSLGVPPALIARIVAGPREVPRVAAGLKGLQRLGIVPLPLAAPAYPDRLRALPDPPLVVYLQGLWPLVQRLLLISGSPLVEPKTSAAWLDFVRNLPLPIGIVTMQPELLDDAAPVRLLGVPFGLMLSRQRLPKQLWQQVSDQRTTLFSIVPPTSQPDPLLAAALPRALLALCDAHIMLPPLTDELVPPARALGVATFTFGAPPREPLPAGVRRLRPATAGLRTLQTTLGIRTAGTETAQQDRLF